MNSLRPKDGFITIEARYAILNFPISILPCAGAWKRGRVPAEPAQGLRERGGHPEVILVALPVLRSGPLAPEVLAAFPCTPLEEGAHVPVLVSDHHVILM